MKKSRVITTVVAVSAMLIAGCSSGGSSSDGGSGSGGALKIGVINPFSGPNAPGGQAIYEGYQLAVDEANAAGGVLGKKVQLVKGDASKPDQGISEVNRLQGSVDVFAGTYISGVAETASQTASRFNKLYWDTNALAADLTTRGLKNFVRSGPAAPQFAAASVAAITKLVSSGLNKPVTGLKVFISHEASVYGTSIAEEQVSALRAAGAVVTDNIGYDYTSPDLSSVILQGLKDKPDVWLETGYVPDGILLLKTAKQQGFAPAATVLVGTGDTTDTLKGVGADILNGVLVVCYPHDDVNPSFGPGADKFLAAFKAKFGSPPVYPQSMTAYVGMQMLLQAITAAKSTSPDAVRTALTKIDKPAGSFATGYGEKFSSDFQNTLATPTVVQWQSGKTVTVYPTAAVPSGAKLQPMG